MCQHQKYNKFYKITGIIIRVCFIRFPNRDKECFGSSLANYFEFSGDREVANIYGVETKEEFVSEFTSYYDKILDSNVKKWEVLIEKYPDRFLWGTDRAYDWHFDEDIGRLLEEMSRSFIGQLDFSVQEKFAYKNAERLIRER